MEIYAVKSQIWGIQFCVNFLTSDGVIQNSVTLQNGSCSKKWEITCWKSEPNQLKYTFKARNK